MVAVFAVPLTKNYRQKRVINREIKSLEAEVTQLEHKNSSLQQVLDYMQSDQFVEEEARTKLNYKKPGEQVVVIETKPGEKTSSTENSPLFDFPDEPVERGEPRLLGNISRWLDYFFEKK